MDCLQAEYQKNKEGVVRFVKDNLVIFIDSAKEINLKTFNLYLNILQTVAIHFDECKKKTMLKSMHLMIDQGNRLKR